jgi:hypothetical protein
MTIGLKLLAAFFAAAFRRKKVRKTSASRFGAVGTDAAGFIGRRYERELGSWLSVAVRNGFHGSDRRGLQSQPQK